MYFTSQEHEAFYKDHAQIRSRGKDYEALVYTLGISESCRDHFSDLYDDKQRSIKSAGLKKGWQTGASTKITRLAFNLFTWHTAADDDPEEYTPKALLNGLDDKNRTGAIYAMLYYA